ncbi:MAG TPA: AmmeMemoRadiSam system protein B [Desulfatiglandales bacterium]|nr:AmmeMemoRadiSam system protein B [Desulfatiglandales bacterium]
MYKKQGVKVDTERPKLRNDLDFIPIQSDGKMLILVQDRLGMGKQGRVINPELYEIMIMLDGTRSIRDIQIELMLRQGGNLVSIEEVEGLLQHLDSHLFLDSPLYRETKIEIISKFLAQQIRYPSHAGLSYPENKEDLKKRLDSILITQKEAPLIPGDKIAALVAPHIDLEAGKKAYAIAYQAIRGIAPKRVVILGVGHSMAKGLFSLTKKSFQTPLGKVEIDQDIVTELTKAGGNIISEDDFAHRDEHSIEFQLIFLQHVLEDVSFSLVPILCGPLGLLPDYSRETYQAVAGEFLRVIADYVKDKETLLICGVDLSHVGPKFGHDRPAYLILDESEAHDHKLLNFLCAGDADGFWLESGRVGDKYHVCGFSVLACLLEILPPSKGHLLSYETFREDPTKSAVSFASAVFTEVL